MLTDMTRCRRGAGEGKVMNVESNWEGCVPTAWSTLARSRAYHTVMAQGKGVGRSWIYMVVW
ncbi:hypothetical protein CTRI78_v008161 [Colletotrichum trifolii]|uniref:Uncharacterized protein n=1 Tax=Colletotrichum trifolii TaxID=5466 RepID=A0A4R8R2T7_COLTR|nr:hypothetical protein CTRI78_v008161 [Colletotrichum trifolii]